MVLPNFLIIGAEKSGTTALYHYLKQHPEVYMPEIKEPDFFAFENMNLNFNGPGEEGRLSITDMHSYENIFNSYSGEKAIGEASPVYLYHPHAARNIYCHVPQARLIVILRNPVERAFSSFLMLVRDNREKSSSFREALQLEEYRKDNNWAWSWQYREVGCYFSQLKRYYEIFPREQIRVYLYEELKHEPHKLFNSIFSFLEVTPDFKVNFSKKHNVSGIPRSVIFHEFLSHPHPLKNLLKSLLPSNTSKELAKSLKSVSLYKPEYPKDVEAQLSDFYREEIMQLQELIGKDLSKWLLT